LDQIDGGGMTLPTLLSTIGWSQTELAHRLGVNERTVRRWMAGDGEPSPAILAWLGEVAAWIEAHPAPEREPNDLG
jgi:transcriptional regulator with XRE-family HTH domain